MITFCKLISKQLVIDTRQQTDTEFLSEQNINLCMSDESVNSLPDDVIDKVVYMTKRSRDESSLVDKRDEILRQYDYRARVRDEDDVLILYPEDWINENKNVDPKDIESIDSAFEIPLSGSRDNADWDEVERINSNIVDSIREEHGEIHGDNTREFADFMGNHKLKKIPNMTEEDKMEFLEYYFPRNVWATDEQESSVEQSMDIIADNFQRGLYDG